MRTSRSSHPLEAQIRTAHLLLGRETRCFRAAVSLATTRACPSRQIGLIGPSLLLPSARDTCGQLLERVPCPYGKRLIDAAVASSRNVLVGWRALVLTPADVIPPRGVLHRHRCHSAQLLRAHAMGPCPGVLVDPAVKSTVRARTVYWGQSEAPRSINQRQQGHTIQLARRGGGCQQPEAIGRRPASLPPELLASLSSHEAYHVVVRHDQAQFRSFVRWGRQLQC